VHPDQVPGYYAAAIVGAQECSDAAKAAEAAKQPRPDCDLREGITADDRTGTVTFHLIGPEPELMYQLALPYASAVPQDTPPDPAPGAIPPATGPYMIRSYTPMQSASAGRPARHGRLELVRNPHFRVWSPAAQPAGYPDRIVLETGWTQKEAVARVTDGRADVLWLDEPPTDGDRLRTRYGTQLHATAGKSTKFAFLNTTKPPFDDRDARRAVAYALDRGALTRERNVLYGQATCQVIPPDFTAYQPYCPFTEGGGADGKWIAPDLTAAADLVRASGTRGARVVLVVPQNLDTPDDARAERRAGRQVVAVLDRLGYRASLRPLQLFPVDADVTDYWEVTDDKAADWNAALNGWVPDYPAASQFLATLASCDSRYDPYNVTGYCDPEVETAIAAALEQQVADPAAASAAWAAIDRKVVDSAAYIPFGNNIREDFVSRRAGNVIVHPVTGPLIAQMWVQ